MTDKEEQLLRENSELNRRIGFAIGTLEGILFHIGLETIKARVRDAISELKMPIPKPPKQQ